MKKKGYTLSCLALVIMANFAVKYARSYKRFMWFDAFHLVALRLLVIMLLAGAAARRWIKPRPNNNFSGYRSNFSYLLDYMSEFLAEIHFMLFLWVLFTEGTDLGGWIRAAIYGLILWWYKKTNYFAVHPSRDNLMWDIQFVKAGQLYQTELSTVAIIHNETDYYLSDFSHVPRNLRDKYLYVVDWERDVLAYRGLTPEVEQWFLDKAKLILYILPATDEADAMARLEQLFPRIWKENVLTTTTMLAVAFVMREPCELKLPRSLGYIGQCPILAFRDINSINVREIIATRYHFAGSGNQAIAGAVSGALGLIKQQKAADITGRYYLNDVLNVAPKKINMEYAIIGCRQLYQAYPDRLICHLRPDSTNTIERWDPFVQEFYRCAILLFPCLPSLMALMDFMDMIFRLSLYTLYAKHGVAPENAVPSSFSGLRDALAKAVRPDDLIWAGVTAERKIPARLPVVLQGIEEAYRVELAGETYTYQGLCTLLNFVRNKTRGHGSLQGDNQFLVWTFAVEASLVLADLLRMEEFHLEVRGQSVFAGWGTERTDLFPYVYATPDGYPVLEFDRHAKQPLFIDYFYGDLFTPSLNPKALQGLSIELPAQ